MTQTPKSPPEESARSVLMAGCLIGGFVGILPWALPRLIPSTDLSPQLTLKCKLSESELICRHRVSEIDIDLDPRPTGGKLDE